MKKSLIVSEKDNIAALSENGRVVEFFVNRGELLLGDIYTACVENILPGIDAAFVNLGKDKMGFLHANDVPGQGPLKERLVPKQKLLVQITKEPTGHKGPRVSTSISLPGRFLVLVPEERSVSISRRISDARERARLKSVVTLMKPPGVGLIIRTEAKGQGEAELFEDFEILWDRWQSIVSNGEASIGPTLVYRDQDLLYRVIRDAYSNDINEIIVDSEDGCGRALSYISGWNTRGTEVLAHLSPEPLLLARGIDKEIETALCEKVELPSGGHLNIQPTEALTVIDVNSGRFTSSRTQAETVRKTNLEAAQEISRQLRLRNIGGMVIVDFIDMESRRDQQLVLEAFQRALEDDRAKPQIGQLSDLGLVELTRRRQGQSLRELFTIHCSSCAGLGAVPTLELGDGEFKRVINTTVKVEESILKGKSSRSNRGNNQSLRAASYSQNRGKPSILATNEEEMDVPEDILEQMPDELLDKRAMKRVAEISTFSEEDDDEMNTPSFNERAEENFESAEELGNIDQEDEDSDELDSEDEEPTILHTHTSISDEEDDDELEEETVTASSPSYYSPYEAEPEGGISGVFRLKAKKDDELDEDNQIKGESEFFAMTADRSANSSLASEDFAPSYSGSPANSGEQLELPWMQQNNEEES